MHPIKYLLPALALATCQTAALAQDRALLIGIADYQVKRFSLKGPANDTQLFKALLTEKLGFAAEDIHILQDSKATHQGILAALQKLMQGTGKGDRIVLYYSGHGAQMPDDNHDEQDGWDEAILPYDIAEDGDDTRHWLRDDDINKALQNADGAQVLAVFDFSQLPRAA
ncbi:MAG: caspase family protein [Candidatus Methylumidiphilus sp.]